MIKINASVSIARRADFNGIVRLQKVVELLIHHVTGFRLEGRSTTVAEKETNLRKM